MANFDDLVNESVADERRQNERAQPTPVKNETSVIEQDSTSSTQTSEVEREAPKGFFSKIKSKIFVSPEERRRRELEKIKATEQKIDVELQFQKEKTRLAKKQQAVHQIAQQRRQESPIGQTFQKIGGFISEQASVDEFGQPQRKTQFERQTSPPLVSGLSETRGYNPGGRNPLQQSQPMIQPHFGHPMMEAPSHSNPSAKKMKAQPNRPMASQNPFGGSSGFMNVSALDEFSPKRKNNNQGGLGLW